MFALAALLAQIAVILVHRAKNRTGSRPESCTLHTVLCLLGITAGWLAIGLSRRSPGRTPRWSSSAAC